MRSCRREPILSTCAGRSSSRPKASRPSRSASAPRSPTSPRRRGNPFEVVVRAEAVPGSHRDRPSVDELKRIPGTQNDAIKAGAEPAGVVAQWPFINRAAGRLGLGANDTRVYADGVLIPVLYHFGGLRSTINSRVRLPRSPSSPGPTGGLWPRPPAASSMSAMRAQGRSHPRLGDARSIDGSPTWRGRSPEAALRGRRAGELDRRLPAAFLTAATSRCRRFTGTISVALRYKPTQRDDLDLLIFGSSDSLQARVENPDPATSVDLNTELLTPASRVRWTHRFSTDTVLTVMPSIGTDSVRLWPAMRRWESAAGGEPERNDGLQPAQRSCATASPAGSTSPAASISRAATTTFDVSRRRSAAAWLQRRWRRWWRRRQCAAFGAVFGSRSVGDRYHANRATSSPLRGFQ